MLPSANLQITPTPHDSRLKSIINALVEDLLRGRHVDAHTKALKAYGAEAVPGLLPHLLSGHAPRRAIALYGLQHCWSPAARDPVAMLLKDADGMTRHMAAIVLAKHEGLGGLAKLCEPLLEDRRPTVAGFAFERVEGEGPDLPRMLRFMRTPGMWDHVWKYLPRYYAPALTPMTLRMMTGARLGPALAAAVALIHQQKRSAAIRQGMAGLLLQQFPMIREAAAEYLLWHGSPSEAAALRAAHEHESDAYAKAAMEAALTAMTRREATVPVSSSLGTRYSSRSLVLPRPARQSPHERYQRALALLRPGAPAADWRTAFEMYRGAEPFEPHWAYKDECPPDDFVATRELRLALQARLFAIPAPAFTPAGAACADETYRGEFRGEPAASLLPPVRDYYDPKRESYGKIMEEETEGFAGMVHIADDTGWHCDHRTVVALGNGLVRLVRCAPTWGCMVVIEHVLPDGQFCCSLYAHLSPFVCVAPGEVVRKGQKIGSIGRSFTWENGGYIAHLHCAIHKGPFWRAPRPGALIDVRYERKLYTGRVVSGDLDHALVEIPTPRGIQVVRKPASWICGYVTKACWDQRRHDWADPQIFLREHENG